MSGLWRRMTKGPGRKRAVPLGTGTARHLKPDEIAAIQRNMGAGGTRTPGRTGEYPITLLGGPPEQLHPRRPRRG